MKRIGRSVLATIALLGYVTIYNYKQDGLAVANIARDVV